MEMYKNYHYKLERVEKQLSNSGSIGIPYFLECKSHSFIIV